MTPIDRIATLIERANVTILDIGANRGDTTAALLQRYPLAHIFAFEPDPRAIRKFERDLRDPRVHLVPKAVGARTGRTTFHQSSGRSPMATNMHHRSEWPEGWDLSGSIRRPTGHLDAYPWCTFGSQIEVEITTLDDWAAANRISGIDLVWADVQGAEEDLIKGGLATLARTRLFHTEYYDREMYEGAIDLAGILALLPQFEIAENFGSDVLLRNTTLRDAAP